jgi:hypothetical protein
VLYSESISCLWMCSQDLLLNLSVELAQVPEHKHLFNCWMQVVLRLFTEQFATLYISGCYVYAGASSYLLYLFTCDVAVYFLISNKPLSLKA